LGVSCWPIGADSRREAVEVSRRHHQPARRHLRKDRTTGLIAIALGLWDALGIIATCNRARGLPVREIDIATARPQNEGNL
jgi:hypothetical protein